MNLLQGPALILNVDDNAVGRYGKTRTLEQAGFDVIEAATGGQALELVTARAPQLVLLDIQLPDLSGLEVCRRIKGNPQTKRIPVLHISATYDAHNGESMSAESGADIFLAEPIEPHELITVVRTLLRLRTMEIGLAESEERMRLATEGAGIATWDIDLHTGAAYWNRELYLMLGYPPSGPAHWEMWRARVHPDDVEAVMQAMDAARHGVLFNREHRVLRADTGEERWLAPYGRVHQDEHGGLMRFLGIVIDITERKQVEAERERLLQLEHAARAEAEKAARLKDEFLATLSHELRSPMSAILGWLFLLRTGRLKESEQSRALDTIERNAQLQNQLINDLLDVSRIITGKLQLNAQPLLLEQVIEEAVNSIRLAAASKNIPVGTDVESVGPIQGDPDRLQQVFVNVLSNAVKFTPVGGHVELRARRVGDYYRVTVTDNGEGIAPELLPHLFERFTQADGSTTRRHGGLGLGLAIVRHLVELHGGRVEAASEGAGKGATFSVMLPLAAQWRLGNYTPGTVTSAVSPNLARRLADVSILVVDDEPGAAQLMTQVLKSEGAVVKTASDARTASALFTAWQPDVLVLDIGMPGEDGYSLVRRLRSALEPGSRPIPAVAVTGYASSADRDRALAAGFDAHLTKPFDVDELLDVLERLLRRAGA